MVRDATRLHTSTGQQPLPLPPYALYWTCTGPSLAPADSSHSLSLPRYPLLSNTGGESATQTGEVCLRVMFARALTSRDLELKHPVRQQQATRSHYGPSVRSFQSHF